MPLTPRQKSLARRNQEMRDLANQNADLESRLEAILRERDALVAQLRRTDGELTELRHAPLDEIATVLAAMPVLAAINADVVKECARVKLWIERVERERQEEYATAGLVASGNEVRRGG